MSWKLSSVNKQKYLIGYDAWVITWITNLTHGFSIKFLAVDFGNYVKLNRIMK